MTQQRESDVDLSSNSMHSMDSMVGACPAALLLLHMQTHPASRMTGTAAAASIQTAGCKLWQSALSLAQLPCELHTS